MHGHFQNKVQIPGPQSVKSISGRPVSYPLTRSEYFVVGSDVIIVEK